MPVNKFGYSGSTITQTPTQSLSGLVKKSGDTMLGDLDLNNHTIYNSDDPVDPQDLATKHYVDLELRELNTTLQSTVSTATGILDGRINTVTTDLNSALTTNTGLLQDRLNTIDLKIDTTSAAHTSALETHKTDTTQVITTLRTDLENMTTNTNTLLTTKLDKSGGVVTGNLDVEGDLTLEGDLILSRPLDLRTHKIINLGMPTLPTDAVTKGYSDLNLLSSGGIMTGDLSMGNNNITNLPEPTDLHHAATKRYVDTVVSDTVRAALTASQAASRQSTPTFEYVDSLEDTLQNRIDQIYERVATLERQISQRSA